MVKIVYAGAALWERIERAVEKVKDRLRRVVQALDAAKIPYAVVGGNAVQIWVAQVDESAVRNTQDVDIVLQRESLPAATAALGQIGMVFREVAGSSMFLDGPMAQARDAVRVVFAGEKVRPDYPLPAPEIAEWEFVRDVRTISLEPLVRMKLTSFRRKDQVHLQDMISVGLIDRGWLAKVPAELAGRLEELLNDPDG